MLKKQYVTIFFSVFFGIIIFLLFLIFKPFLAAIAWAVILATLSYPVYNKLHKILNLKSETLSALLMTLLILFILILPALFLGTTLTTEILSAYKYVNENYLAQGAQGKEWFQKTNDFLAQYKIDLKKIVANNFKIVSTTIVSQTGDVFKGLVKNTIKFFLTIFTLFFLFKYGGNALAELKWVIPISNTQKSKIFERFREVLYAIMYGILLTAIVQGTLGGLGFYIVGIPSPVLFGAIMTLCALLPAGGTSLVWLPAAAILFFQDHPGKAIFLVLWGFLVVGLIDNVMKPIFISGRSKLNFILVFFGILGGINLFGLVGVFVGPLIIAIFLAFLEIFKLQLKSRHRAALAKK